MEHQFWRKFAVGFFIVNTICVVMLFEFFIWGKPYMSLFLFVFGLTIIANKKLFSKIIFPANKTKKTSEK